MHEEVVEEYDSSAMAKLMRAGEHFHSLEQEVDAWNRQNLMLAPTRRNARDPHQLDVFLPSEPELPLIRWSSRFGDGVHNLRAALDLLAFEMCHLDGKAPGKPKKVSFPIAKKESGWPQETNTNLGSMPPALLDRIKEVQPWHTSNPAAHPLIVIQGLDNMDKHRSTVDVIALPGGLATERLRSWPDAVGHEKAWTAPWLRVTLDRALPSDFGPALWDVDAWPAVHFEGRMAPLADLQRWLFQQAGRIFEFITSGEWPAQDGQSAFFGKFEPVPEPSWVDIPSWGIQPSVDS